MYIFLRFYTCTFYNIFYIYMFLWDIYNHCHLYRIHRNTLVSLNEHSNYLFFLHTLNKP